MRKAQAPPPASPAAVTKGHTIPDIVSVFLVYVVSGIGFLIIGSSLMSSSSLDSPPSTPLLLFGILPLATLIILGFQIRSLFRSFTRRRYGSHLRAKLAALFMGVVLMASLPQGILTLRLVNLAGEALRSTATLGGAKEGLRLLLAWQDADRKRLESIASDGFGRFSAATGDPEALLAALQAIEPRMEAVEIFARGRPARGAGPAEARLAERPQAGISGALPTETREGVSRLRQAVARGDSVIVLCLRLPEGWESATSAIAAAAREAEAMVAATDRWPAFIGFMYALFVLPLFLLALMIGIAAADFVSEPLAGLEEATKRIASGDTRMRLLAKQGDERGWLIASFNRMLDEMERWREGDRMQERIDAWKDIAQRLAHELKNPLTPIRLASERLLRTARNDPPRALEILESSTLAIIAEVDGMDNLLGDFKSFASLPSPQRDWCDLAELVEDSIAVYRASYPEVEFTTGHLPEGTRLHVDKAMIKRALGNLIANAIEAMEGKGRLDIGADLVKTGDSGYCRLRLSDTGCGIRPEDRDRVFIPYFTTRKTGTGLGLAIVERVLHDHGGRIRFDSTPGTGTVFWIDLPVAR